jgi:hypothetical protein
MASQITPGEFFNTQEKQNPADSTQLSVLKRLFSDPSVSVSELARLASIPILKDLQKDSNVPPNPYAFWRPIANAVKVLPEYHDKLVEFMIELQKIQCPGTYNLIDGYRQFWAEEAWSCESSTSPLSCHALLICFVSDDSSISTSSTEQGAWMNLNIFSAKLSATKIPALDELDRGGNTLRDTLENIQSNSSGEDLKIFNGLIPAAAVWIEICGKEIYAQEGEIAGGWPGDDNETSEWNGKRGSSKERFAFWRSRFQDLSTYHKGGINEEVRKTSRETADLMVKIESST